MGRVDNSKFGGGGYSPGAPMIVQVLWYATNAWFMCCRWNVSSGLRVMLLRLYGAKVGRGVVIKPAVNVKHPWRLRIGDHAWIGEGAWIDNLEMVDIGAHCCISQGATLETGNHDYSARAFDYRNAPITLEEGVWIGVRSVVCPGTVARSHAVLAAGSVASGELKAYTVYRGNPAVEVKQRTIDK